MKFEVGKQYIQVLPYKNGSWVQKIESINKHPCTITLITSEKIYFKFDSHGRHCHDKIEVMEEVFIPYNKLSKLLYT